MDLAAEIHLSGSPVSRAGWGAAVFFPDISASHKTFRHVAANNFLLLAMTYGRHRPFAKPSLHTFFPLGFAQFLARAALQKSISLRSSAALRPPEGGGSQGGRRP